MSWHSRSPSPVQGRDIAPRCPRPRQYLFSASAASSAGFPACGFTELSSSAMVSEVRTGDWKVPRTRRQECLRYAAKQIPASARAERTARDVRSRHSRLSCGNQIRDRAAPGVKGPGGDGLLFAADLQAPPVCFIEADCAPHPGIFKQLLKRCLCHRR